MRSTALVAGVAATALGLMAATASAVPPQHFAQDPLPRVVQDTGQACGFPVRWTIDLTVQGTNFFDSEGRLVRQQAHIREDNTITNVATGLTLREGPDSFMQTIYFNPDGTISHFVATGLAANVQAEGENLKDVGRVIWLPGTNEIVFSAGPHPVREAIEFGNFQTALAAFCEVLA
jgi:hypothetical protein